MSLAGYMQKLLMNVVPKRYYFEDALITTHNHSFVNDLAFKKAYQRGLKATGGIDYHNQWRVYMALWVARTCSKLDGDFVECGVNYGLTSSAIMEYLEWDKLGKQFWLVDSFSGIDERQVTEKEKNSGIFKRNAVSKRTGFYNCDVERSRLNFSEWKTASVIQGWIPQCLDIISSTKIAFIHIDLNSAIPEIQAFKYFLPRLCHGSFVLLDDYGYTGYDTTYTEWNKMARELDLDILSLPTGQGLIHISPQARLGVNLT
jgi:hypothetical protein